jgi:YD repeat-containing protein
MSLRTVKEGSYQELEQRNYDGLGRLTGIRRFSEAGQEVFTAVETRDDGRIESTSTLGDITSLTFSPEHAEPMVVRRQAGDLVEELLITRDVRSHPVLVEARLGENHVPGPTNVRVVDLDGKLLSSSQRLSPNSAFATTTWVYGAAGELLNVSGPLSESSFDYDPQGRISAWRTDPPDGTAGAPLTRCFRYDGRGDLAAEWSGRAVVRHDRDAYGRISQSFVPFVFSEPGEIPLLPPTEEWPDRCSEWPVEETLARQTLASVGYSPGGQVMQAYRGE